jgi:hypothetical protein
MSFSDRVLGHGQISVKPAAAGEPQVLAMKNQLLVRTKPWASPDPAEAVHGYLESQGMMVERDLTPLGAWEWLRDNEGGPKTNGLGYRFT